RIVIVSIRNLGKCPCPRCLIPLDRVHRLGMTQDMTQRVGLSRVDDNHRRGKVMACRSLIYDESYRVDGKAIDNLLGETSLVPKMVGCINVSSKIILNGDGK